jgi:hypothetical protein
MNNDITEQYLNNTYDNFSREQQKILNDLKTSSEEKKVKHLQKEINIIHSIEINLLKLKSLRKIYDDKIKNL